MNTKKQFLCQIIYGTSQDKKGVVCVIAIFLQMKITAHVVALSLGQDHEARDCGDKYDLPWKTSLEVT